MLTRMAMKPKLEAPTRCGALLDYEHEHRCAEHEHEEKSQNDVLHWRSRAGRFQRESQPRDPGDDRRSGMATNRARAQPLAAVLVLVIE